MRYINTITIVKHILLMIESDLSKLVNTKTSHGQCGLHPLTRCVNYIPIFYQKLAMTQNTIFIHDTVSLREIKIDLLRQTSYLSRIIMF